MQHDAHYKRLFGHPRMTGDLLALLQLALGEQFPILRRVQPDTLQRLSGEFIGDDLRRRFADLIWKVRLSEPVGTEQLAATELGNDMSGLSGATGSEPWPIDDRDREDHRDLGGPDDGADRGGDPSHHDVERRLNRLEQEPGADQDRDPTLSHHWLYLVVLLEFQSTVDWMMTVRVQDYAAQLWLDMHRREPFGRNRTPPPILPVVIYNGDPPWNAPTRVIDIWRRGPASEERADGGIEAGALQFVGDGFVLLDLKALEDGALPDANGVTWLARVESVDDEKSLFATLAGIFEWLDNAADGTLSVAILGWMRALNDASEFVKAEEFEMAIQTAEGKKRRQGHWTERVRQDRLRTIAQAREQGREEGETLGLERERTLLARQASRRFGVDAAHRLVPILDKADHDTLINIGDWIVDCRDAEELLRFCSGTDAEKR